MSVDDLAKAPQGGRDGITPIPHEVLLSSSIDLNGNTHYQSVGVNLMPGSDAMVMCVAASSQFPQNVLGACVPITPSFPSGAEIPNVYAVPLPQRRVLIESKSGLITLGCKDRDSPHAKPMSTGRELRGCQAVAASQTA